ncbi:uncharacterized protein LOC124145724 [Haliotis rufescens]|uniref:uncharacterized protein LOC124145724 n=1 Tax=Haliotis rufescens TaxID=6454 RepID=UPI00201EFCAC|nr:uncharacterized protein LOC124145724 [Haliotis rufescens]
MGIDWRILVSVLFWALLFKFSRPETNLALTRPSSASSSYSTNGAQAGNDGNTDGSFPSGSCFASADRDSDPWWQVDLQATFMVKRIEITNRQDCCAERIHHISLVLFDQNPSVESLTPSKPCYFILGTDPAPTVTVTCTRPVNGRYLRLTKTQQLNIYDLLQFCEVKVYGELTYDNSLCTSFQQTRGARYDAASILTQGPEVDSSAACASTCERVRACTGFNIRYKPEVTCELVQDSNPTSLDVDAAWDFYLYKSCWKPCVIS